jgi:hypothetical protein
MDTVHQQVVNTSDYPQLSQGLWASLTVHDDMPKHVLGLMDDILSTSCKCILSAL